MGNTDIAFEQLYESTKKELLVYIASRCNSVDDIEDLYQETYISVFDSMQKMSEPINNAEAFVKTVAKRIISRHYSAANKLRAKLSISLDSFRESGVTEDIADETDIEESVCTDELYDEVYDIIKTMPIVVQRLIYMRYKLQLSIAEIAATTEMSETAVCQRINKALAAVRRTYTRRKRQ